jgi:hypothetical protein
MNQPSDYDPRPTPAAQTASNPPLLSVRSALVFLLSAVAGVVAGLLVFAAGHTWANAVGAGLATAGGALPLVNQIIEGDR